MTKTDPNHADSVTNTYVDVLGRSRTGQAAPGEVTQVIFRRFSDPTDEISDPTDKILKFEKVPGKANFVHNVPKTPTDETRCRLSRT